MIASSRVEGSGRTDYYLCEMCRCAYRKRAGGSEGHTTMGEAYHCKMGIK